MLNPEMLQCITYHHQGQKSPIINTLAYLVYSISEESHITKMNISQNFAAINRYKDMIYPNVYKNQINNKTSVLTNRKI